MFALQAPSDWLSGVTSAPGFVPAVACLSFVLFYYLAMWFTVGRDPRAGNIVSRYEPPGGLSPAAIRYLRKACFDNKALIAAVLDIAAHGCAKVTVEYGRYVLTRISSDLENLPPEERAFAGRLLKDGFIDFSEESGEHIRECAETLKNSVRDEVERRFLKTNSEYVIVGIAVSALAALQVLRMTPGGIELLRWALVLAALGAGGMFLNSFGYLDRTKERKRSDNWVQSGRIAALSSVLLGGGIAVERTSWALASIAAMIAINLLFQRLLKAPTQAGRAMMDEVEGFREFLSAVELDKFKTIYPGSNVPDVMDRFFPYAFALDLEHEWNDRFGAAVRDSIRVRRSEDGVEGWDIADALSVITAVALGGKGTAAITRV